MTSNKRVSWEKDIRESIRTNFGAGWRVNGEQSGKTKILYVSPPRAPLSQFKTDSYIYNLLL